MERNEHLILVNENAICDIETLIEWLHAVDELSFWRNAALVKPIGGRDENYLRLTFRSHIKDLNSPGVFDGAERLWNYFWKRLLFKIDHGKEAFCVAANNVSIIQDQRNVSELMLHTFTNNLCEKFILLMAVNLNSASAWCQSASEAHENLISWSLDGVEFAATRADHMDWLG